MSVTNVCYYVTGHGLGHATRSLELIRGLLLTGRFKIHVVTNVNEAFFTQNLVESGVNLINSHGESNFYHHSRSLDAGAVQADVFVVDPMSTLDKYYTSIHLKRNELVEHEVTWLKSENIQLVLVDATPLGCAVGAAAGAKVVMVTNFTWDFCYREMLQSVVEDGRCPARLVPEYHDMVEQCSVDTSQCTAYIQYPGKAPLPPDFDVNKVIDGPLIARNPRATLTRKDLNISEADRVLLLGFGGHDVKWNLSDSCLPEGWVCFILGAGDKPLPSSRFRALGFDSYVPDLIDLSDAVLGKIGYGFVSECISCGTCLIYVPRVDWPEERYVESLLCTTYGAGLKMSMSDFTSGSWKEYLEKAHSLKKSWHVDSGSDSYAAIGVMIKLLDDVI